MIIAEFAGLLFLVVASVALMHRNARFFERRLREQDVLEEQRRAALYKQQKATATTINQSDRAVRRLADETRHLKEESELALRRADAFFADPRVKRVLDKEG